jgi:hypothetical protein
MSAVDDNSVLPPGRSWRNIRQEVQPQAMSRWGRRRQRLEWVKLGALFTCAVFAAGSAYEVVHAWETDRASLATAVRCEPVRNVVLVTDGVLTKKWVDGVLGLPNPASLMALDLPALRDKLRAHAQVRAAVLTRSFPDTLVVTLQERTPVARVQADDGLGAPRQLMVAKDGVVYEGLNYDKPMLAGLPWLAGIRLERSGNGFAAIDGMGDVSALLSTAQLQAPHLYREWLIVSLARLADRDEIVVKAQDIPEIVFSRKRDFFKQIAQLDYVVDQVRMLPEPALQSVNLVLEGQVPVKLQHTTDELMKMSPPNFSIQPPQRKGKRDL